METKSSTHVESASGSLVATEDIRTELLPRDLTAGNVLDSGPPLGIQQDLVGDPVGNGLLFETRPPKEGSDLIGQLGLATNNLDCLSERTNVRFLHDHASYKPACIHVNKHARVTSNKAACIVIDMQTRTQKKPKSSTSEQRKQRPTTVSERKKVRKPFQLGKDNRTANERYRIALKAWKEDRGTEKTLVARINLIAQHVPTPSDKDFCSQQTLNTYKNDVTDFFTSRYLVAIAEAMDVRPLWLYQGIGEMRDGRIRRIAQILEKSGI